MNLFKGIAATAAVAAGAVALASPAGAVITTFATYSPVNTGANVRFINSGSNGSNGTSGTLQTVAAPTSSVAAPVTTRFSFLQSGLSSVINNIDAVFSLNATVSSRPAQAVGNTLIQDGLNGSFSFRTTQAYTIGNTVYAAGSNLLTGVFTGAQIVGQRGGTSANFNATTGSDPSETLAYTSDFLNFPNVSVTDFSISITAVQSALAAVSSAGVPTRALRTFRGVSSGNFSSDPAPLVNALVPEASVWGMMILGFGLVGAAMRVRRRQVITA